MKFFGKEFTFNGFKVYHAGDKPTPADIGASSKKNGVYYVEGTGTTAGTWTGSHGDITEYYDGLTIAYKINIAGASATTLNINGLGAKTVRRDASALTTHLPVNTVVLLVYTTISGTGYWVWADYNSDAKVSQPAAITTAGEFPVLLGYSTATTAVTNAVKKTTSLLYNPNTKVLTAPTFKGALKGNADTATKATQDGNGKNIADTYATKAEVTAAQGAKVYVSATQPTGTIATGSLWL